MPSRSPVLTQPQLALLLDPAGFARRSASAFLQLTSEVLLSPDACEAALRVLVESRRGRAARPSSPRATADEARRFVALADAEGAFGFDVEELVRLFGEPALFARVAATLHPARAAQLAALASPTSAAPGRPASNLTAGTARRARSMHARRAVVRRSHASPGVWATVTAVAALLMVAVVLGLMSSDSGSTGGNHSPTADDEANAPTIVPHDDGRTDGGNRTPDTNDAGNRTPEQVDGNGAPERNHANEPRDPFHDPDLPDPDGSEPDAVDRPDTPDRPDDPTPRDDPTQPDAVDRPDADPQDPAPQPRDPQDPQPRDPVVEQPDDPDSTDPTAPTDPADPQFPQPQQPTALLSVTAFDGRGDFLDANERELDADTLRELSAGQTISLTRGTLRLAFLDGTGSGSSFGQLVLHGRTEVRLADDATVAAPVLEIHHGELLVDTTMLPARYTDVPDGWHVRIGRDGHDLDVRLPAVGDEPFTAAVDCSRTRLTVQVLSGGASATLGGTSLAGMAAAVLAFRDGDVDVRDRRDGQPLPLPAWVARANLGDATLLAADFEDAEQAAQWGGERVPDPTDRNGRHGEPTNHVLRMTPPDDADHQDEGTQRAGFVFSHPQDAASRLPNWSGLVLRLRVHAERATTLTIHFFDGAIRENYSVDLPLHAGWQELELPLTEFRNRGDGSDATTAQRFQNLNFITPDDAGAVAIDDVRLARAPR